jgi:hypothetical protein
MYLLRQGPKIKCHSERIQKWYAEYLTNYRDALSHRIPLYVPPKSLTPEHASQVKQIENKIADCYKSCDFNTIEEIVEKYCEMCLE